MPVVVIAIVLFSLLFGVFHESPTVRQRLGVRIESGKKPDVDWKIKIEGEKGRAVIRL